MKRFIYILTVTLFSLMIFSSCEKQLTMIPVNSLTFGGVENEEDFEALLNQVAWYAREISFEKTYPAATGVYADSLTGFAVRVQRMEYELTRFFWGNYYYIIAQANLTLTYLDKLDFPQDRKDYYRGTLLFYKAFAYNELIKIIGDVPLVKEDTPIGIIGREPWTKIALHAIELAQEAAELLPNFGEAKNSTGLVYTMKHVPTKGAANALLADLASWYAGGQYHALPSERTPDVNKYWKIAEDACSAIIEDTKNYSLGTIKDVCTTLQIAGNHSESVFELPIKDNWHENVTTLTYYTLATWSHDFPVKKTSTYKSILTSPFLIKEATVKEWFKEGDARRVEFFWDVENDSTVVVGADDNGLPIMGIREYKDYKGMAYPYKLRHARYSVSGPSSGTFESFNTNDIRYRLADIILLRAECRVRQGNDAGAIEDLNTVRNRAGASPYSPSEFNGDLRYTIFKEREKELVMEGKRYFDIIRNGYVRTELSIVHAKLTDQELIDGALTVPVSESQFIDCPAMRQNRYWHSKAN